MAVVPLPSISGLLWMSSEPISCDNWQALLNRLVQLLSTALKVVDSWSGKSTLKYLAVSC